MLQAPKSRGFFTVIEPCALGLLSAPACRVFPAHHCAALKAVLHLGAGVPKEKRSRAILGLRLDSSVLQCFC